MEYLIHLGIIVGIYLILAQSFNLVFGVGGLFNLAHIAVYAIGAYTTALLSTAYGFDLWICLPASMLLAGVFALLIGAISLKLSQDYFAIGSLAFSAVVSAVLINWKSLTRGVLGIPGVPRPTIFGIDFYRNTNFLILTAACVAVTYTALYFIFESRLGKRLRAQAEHPAAAASLGISLIKVKNLSFFLSSFFAGGAGCLFAYHINYIDPSSFGLHEMVFVLSIAIVGKPGSFWGVTLATVFLVLLPEPLRFIEISPGILGPMRQLLYALILFAVVYWRRDKLFPVQRVI